MSIKKPKFFCPMPFVAMTIRADGDFSPCFLTRFHSKKTDPRYGSLQASFQDPEFTELRQKFLNEEKPSACQRCWEAEDKGLVSYRQKAQDLFGDLDLQEPLQVQVAEFSFGNRCQGACITCGNVSSSGWSEDTEYLIAQAPGRFDRTQAGLARYTLSAWRDEDLRALKVLCFFQSETLAQPEFKDFLIRLKTLNVLSGMRLQISTNSTVFPEDELLALLLEARELEMSISVDALEEKFEYLRHPLSWSDFLSTAQKWLQLAVSHDKVRVNPHFTFSILNLFEFEKVKTWWKEFAREAGLKSIPSISKGQVSHPDYLRPELLQGLSEELPLPEYAQKILRSPSRNREELLKLRETARDYLALMDKKRGRDYRRLFPEISGELNNSPSAYWHGESTPSCEAIISPLSFKTT